MERAQQKAKRIRTMDRMARMGRMKTPMRMGMRMGMRMEMIRKIVILKNNNVEERREMRRRRWRVIKCLSE